MRTPKTPKRETRQIEDILNNLSDRAKLQNFIDEAVRSKSRIAAEQEQLKAIREAAVEDVGIEGKMFNQLTALFFNNNFSEKQAELEKLDTAIDLLLMNKGE
jgi:hypothetical protein